MAANGYQDLNALLRTLSSYVPGASQPQGPELPPSGQYHPVQQQQQQYTAPADAGLGAWPNASSQYDNNRYVDANAYANQYIIPPTVQPEVISYSNRIHPSLHSQAHVEARTTSSTNEYSPYAYNILQDPAPPVIPRSSTYSQLNVKQSQQPHDVVQPAPAPPPAPGPDPRTIMEWPAALRHVTKLAAKNETLGYSIRKMIANQNENERQWWAGREALVEKQAARVEGKRKLDEVLKSVGAQSAASAIVTDDVAELKLYDKKVYRAQVLMNKSMETDLETLGIPFFGTNASLVAGKDEQILSADEKRNSSTKLSNQQRTKLSFSEHLELQRKMIQHLEDMYKED